VRPHHHGDAQNPQNLPTLQTLKTLHPKKPTTLKTEKLHTQKNVQYSQKTEMLKNPTP
jgi:hypothetical protein